MVCLDAGPASTDRTDRKNRRIATKKRKDDPVGEKAKGRTNLDGSVQSGFTLLEILVAVVILMMIVMMMGSVFNQMRVAWEVGMRRSKLNVEGRAAASFMCRELSQAVADPKLKCVINDGQPNIDFYFIEDATETNRAIYRVIYGQSGNTITRRLARHALTGYPGNVEWTTDTVLAKNVSRLRFYTADGNNYSTNLPQYVDIEIRMGASAAIARFVAASKGPDGKWDNGAGDDLTTDQ